MIIIPPSIFTTPARRGRGGGGSYEEGPWWEGLVFVLAVFSPIILMFAWMWYDVEYNIKPAQERQRIEAQARYDEWAKSCTDQGGTVIVRRVQTGYDYKYRKPRYGNRSFCVAVTITQEGS